MDKPLQTITAYHYKLYKVKYKKDLKDENSEKLEHETVEELMPIDTTGKNGINIEELLKEFFEEMTSTPYTSEYRSKVLKVEEYEVGEKHLGISRTHCSTIAGFYGRLLKIFDVKKGENTQNVNLDEAVMASYNVYFYYGNGASENICVFHRCGNGGCKTIFMEKFIRFLKNHGYKIEMKAILDDDAKELIKNGRILEMNLTKTTSYIKKTTDIADKIDEKEVKQKQKEYTLNINCRGRDNILGKMIDGISSEKMVREIFEFIPEDFDFDIDETSYLLEIGRRQKKVYNDTLKALFVAHDITNDLTYDENNYPTLDSLSNCVDLYAKKYM